MTVFKMAVSQDLRLGGELPKGAIQPSINYGRSEEETFIMLSHCDLGLFVKAATVN